MMHLRKGKTYRIFISACLPHALAGIFVKRVYKMNEAVREGALCAAVMIKIMTV